MQAAFVLLWPVWSRSLPFSPQSPRWRGRACHPQALCWPLINQFLPFLVIQIDVRDSLFWFESEVSEDSIPPPSSKGSCFMSFSRLKPSSNSNEPFSLISGIPPFLPKSSGRPVIWFVPACRCQFRCLRRHCCCPRARWVWCPLDEVGKWAGGYQESPFQCILPYGVSLSWENNSHHWGHFGHHLKGPGTVQFPLHCLLELREKLKREQWLEVFFRSIWKQRTTHFQILLSYSHNIL